MLVAILAGAAPARASAPVRYALIVGNDVGLTSSGVPLQRLMHAEREAAELRDGLVRFGAFPDAPDRVVSVLGKGRSEILAAARRLAEQRRRDRQRWGNIPTLFAFFFTGHGLEGQLLTADEPLNGSDLASIFQDVGATFTFGMFDACFSGSIDLGRLRAKGLQVTGGFNAFEQLPHEVLSSQGTMWVVSSRSDQVSYEDERLGGLFTHFFIEALQKAKADDFGISVDAIWEYASRQTQQRANSAGRSQTPQKMVRDLTASGPVYFSFPRPRTAELKFAPEVEGEFLVRYEAGELSEAFVKTAGQAKRLRLFPGTIWIERRGARTEQQRVQLAAGGVVTVLPDRGWQSASGLGRRQERIAPKGEALEDLAVIAESPHPTLALGLGYRGSLPPTHSSTPHHMAEIIARVDRDNWSIGAGLAKGWQSDSFDVWSYKSDRSDIVLALGPAWNFSRFRLGVSAQARYSWCSTIFADGNSRATTGWSGGGYFDVLAPIWRSMIPLYATAQLGLNVEKTTPAALGTPVRSDWSAVPTVGFGIAAVVY